MSSRHRAGSLRPPQVFLVTPHFEWKRTVRYFQVFNHGAGAMPAALLVEPRGAVVSNGAPKPGCVNAAVAKTSFCIDNQSRGDTRTSRLRRNIELIKLSALQHAKTKSHVRGASDAHTSQSDT